MKPSVLGDEDSSLISPWRPSRRTEPKVISDLVDIDVNVINPLQPDCMDAATVERKFGEKLAMWGTVGTARLWDLGTPDQIRAEVQHRIKTLGPEGLLLAPAYDIDYAPFENIVAFVDTVEEFERWRRRMHRRAQRQMGA